MSLIGLLPRSFLNAAVFYFLIQIKSARDKLYSHSLSCVLVLVELSSSRKLNLLE